MSLFKRCQQPHLPLLTSQYNNFNLIQSQFHDYNNNTNHLQLNQISKRHLQFSTFSELNIRGKTNYYAQKFYKKEVVNTEPISEFIFHEPHPAWRLLRTTASNPRQIHQIQRWQPVPGLRKLRGHTPGSLHAILPDLQCLWQHGSSPALTTRIVKSGGRYYTGQITCRHRGGKCSWKKYYRVIDFKRSIEDEEGIVERIEFDTNRSSYIALIRYPKSSRIQYMLSVDGLQPGDIVYATQKEPKHFRRGFAMKLKYVPDKASICCLEFRPGNGAQCIRSAGTFAKLLNKNGTRRGYALIEMQSKELRLFDLECMCVLGRVSNVYHNKIKWGKAGNRRIRGWRPSVKGVSMSAYDHPHGGGTKHKRTRPFYGGGYRTKWGQHTIGFKTRKKRKWRVPVEMQMILKRRPRHFKPGQLF